MAVPAPSAMAPSAHDAKPWVAAMVAMATAWVHMPATISRLRPHRSDKAPVRSWPRPQTAG